MAMTELQRLRINIRNVLRQHDASAALMADIDRVFGVKTGEIKPRPKFSSHRVNKIYVTTQGVLKSALEGPYAIKHVDIPVQADRDYRLIVLKYRDKSHYEDSVILESPRDLITPEIKQAISLEGLSGVFDTQRYGTHWSASDLVFSDVDINALPRGFNLYVQGPDREPFRFTHAMIVNGY